MEKEYINPNNPVYFSYAWEDDKHPNIEDDVNKLCKLLEDNLIYYKRDKENLCPYRWSIQKAEEEIGEGTAIIVVISERYLKSLHCMNEWHLIRENGKIRERVYPIVLEDANITDKKVYRQFYDFFEKRQEELLNQQREKIIPLTQIDLDTIQSDYFIDDYKRLYKYLADYNRLKISLLREDNYKIIIEQLKEQVKGFSKNEIININTPTTPHFKFYVPDGLIIEIRKGLLEDGSELVNSNHTRNCSFE